MFVSNVKKSLPTSIQPGGCVCACSGMWLSGGGARGLACTTRLTVPCSLLGWVVGGGGGSLFSPPPPPPPLGPFLPPLTHRRSGPLDVSMFVSCLLRLEARVFAYLVPDAA